jgi:hypothetical protein
MDTADWLKEKDKAATAGRSMHFVSSEDPAEKLGWRSIMNDQGTILALRVIGLDNAEALTIGRNALPVLEAALRALGAQGLMLDCLETLSVGLAAPDRKAVDYFIEQIAAPTRAVIDQADALREAHG